MPAGPPPLVDDERQAEVVALPAGASGVVLGGPGTGKTATLIARVSTLLRSGVVQPDELLVLTPTRQTATALRDRLAAGLDIATPGPLARSIASFAFQVVRAAAVAAKEPLPQLLTAGDQDRIIAELLAGDDEDAASGRPRWPERLGSALRGSRQFRSELRALFAECAERGISPADLGEVGRAASRPAWVAAGSFFAEYRDTLGAMRAAHREAAELVVEAASLLTGTGPVADARVGPAGRLRVVLVDDAQELSAGGLALVAALRRRGVAVLALGDPDIGSGAFRGSGPELFARLCATLGSTWVLDAPHRAAPEITHLVRTVTAAIGVAGRVEHRRAPGAAPEGDGVTTHVLGSPFEEVDRVARLLREWHVMHGTPWGRLAVIVHDSRQVSDLEVELAAREVPTRAAALPRPLGGEQVVRDLLSVVSLGLAPAGERQYDDLVAALLSPFGGLDAVSVRRLRARLRQAELADGGARAARELLVEAMADPIELAGQTAPEGRAAARLAETLAAVHAQGRRGVDIHRLLWTVWDAARSPSGRRLADAWGEAASAPGALAAETGRALDALVALFDAAKRFVERSPGERPEVFVRRVLDSAVPEDTLTTPDRPDAVAVLTPAAALGTEFDGVVVAGVQDGVWPNLRLRGGSLESWRLADDVRVWRETGGVPEAPDVVDRRRAALHDELRLFVRAVSRARSRVAVTAVDDDDLGPSPLFGFLPDPQPGRDAEAEHPFTLRGLVARHRRTLTVSASDDERAAAAAQLAVMVRERVPGADPSEWFGLRAPTATGPLRDADRVPVPLSPSKLKTFEECPLDWAIRALGGDVRTWSAGAGTILHAAMEDVPTGELDDLRAVVDARWGELEFEADWLSRKERAWAEVLTGRLHAYLREFHRHGGVALGAESRFRLAVGLDAEPDAATPVHVLAPDAERPEGRLAVLSGSIDRVERFAAGAGERLPIDPDDPADRVVIADLKTGRSEKRLADAKVVDDPQLAAYQLALLEGSIPGTEGARNAGARLIVLSHTTRAEPQYRLARQPPMDAAARAAFLERIVRVAREMAAASFAAPVDAHCATSRFGVCALHTVKAVSSS
ncbi:ATP-dependent DNA helicase [Microbacterium awajiense]|uniref:DNA 3'-5' helicase n=1 Tax=Microbacterium awajiense TaxID=415214 RepID=A0ABP7AAC1_9MICO